MAYSFYFADPDNDRICRCCYSFFFYGQFLAFLSSLQRFLHALPNVYDSGPLSGCECLCIWNPQIRDSICSLLSLYVLRATMRYHTRSLMPIGVQVRVVGMLLMSGVVKELRTFGSCKTSFFPTWPELWRVNTLCHRYFIWIPFRFYAYLYLWFQSVLTRLTTMYCTNSRSLVVIYEYWQHMSLIDITIVTVKA